MFLFDPTQHPAFRKACHGRTSDPQFLFPRPQVFRQDTVLLEAAHRLRRLTNLKHHERHNRPLFVLVTKFDAWRGIFDADLSELPLKPTGMSGMWALDWNRVDEISAKLRTVLDATAPEIVSAAEGLAQDVIYLPVSATGCGPLADEHGNIQGIPPARIRPIWVEVPFLAALARWSGGLVPYAIRKTRSSAGPATPPSSVPSRPPPVSSLSPRRKEDCTE